MSKRRTRSSNKENDTDVSVTDSHTKKRSRGKSTGANKPLDEQTIVNTLVDEPTFTTLQPVLLDQDENVNDRDTSPPPLIIDTDKETFCSQSVMSDYFSRREPIGERLPRQTLNDGSKTANCLSSNPIRCTTDTNHSDNINRSKKARPREEIRTPIADRSTNGQLSSNIRSQSSTSRIVVSVDRRRRDSDEDLNQNHRTSTPIRPSRPPPMNIGSSNDYTDSFSIDSIPQDTFNMLTRFPEFRRLMKAYKTEQKKCQTWEKDYACLHKNYQQLEENSFPRPPAAAMNYLVDMVSVIQKSGGRADPRTDEQIARDLGESSIFLVSLRDPDPQQTALNLFNHFYPSYEDKLKLETVPNLEKKNPGFLQTILTFSQRAAPGTNYKLGELRACLGNSIRGARHSFNKLNRSTAGAKAIRKQTTNQIEIQHENDVNQVNEFSTHADDDDFF